MKIFDLDEQNLPLYFACLEEWSDEMKEAGDHKARWYTAKKDQGLRVKLASDDQGRVGGMIQYLPIEQTFAEGENLYLVLCIWVHGHKKGRGNFQKKGMGKALLKAAEDDVKDMGYSGLAVWGLSIPVFMRASWFRKQGYRKADRQGIQVLLWKSFDPNASPPRWIKPKKKPELHPNQVNVTCLITGWCPTGGIACERAKRAAAEFGDAVRFEQINTLEPDVFNEWGRADALFVDGREIRIGPPPTYKKIYNRIARRAAKLSSS